MKVTVYARVWPGMEPDQIWLSTGPFDVDDRYTNLTFEVEIPDQFVKWPDHLKLPDTTARSIDG